MISTISAFKMVCSSSTCVSALLWTEWLHPPPPHSYVEALIPSAMVFVGGGLR